MPIVPTYNSPQVAPAAFSGARVQQPDAIPDFAGAQTQQMSAGLMQTGAVVSAIEQDMQDRANRLRVDDALNQLKQEQLRLTFDKDAGFKSLKGIDAIQRPDNKDLASEYGDKLDERMKALSEGLGNDVQREAFHKSANDISTAFHGSLLDHQLNEYRSHSLSVSEGVQATAQRSIELNWNNPGEVAASVERIRAETYRQASLLGKSAEWQEAAARKLTSNAHKTAIMAALEQNNAVYAEGYLNKFSKDMDGDDILAVRGHITKSMDVGVSNIVADETLRKFQPRIQVGEADRAFNILLGTESRGKQFNADGSVVTSPKGAIGIAQVMPATGPEAAKLAGLQWDEQKFKTDAGYNRALGAAYFNKQLQSYGGELDKAYAAYNAGPGRLNDALEQSKKTGRPWLSFMPDETQKYVAKNMAEFGAGGGQPVRPTFAEIDDALRADPRLANNPNRYKLAREEAERRYNEQGKAIKQREDEATATAMRGVIENGGRFTDLPVSVRAAIPPSQVDNVMSFAQKYAKGDDTTSLMLYNKLTANPGVLRSMSDDQFFMLRRELSEADFKHFSNERAKLTGAVPGANGPGDLNTSAIKQEVDQRLRMMNIDPTPKDDGGNDAARVGAIRQYVDQYFYTAQREAGKKFGDAEVASHVDKLFSRTGVVNGWFSDSSAPMLSLKVGDIDGETKKNIKAAYKRQGIDSPTDAQIMNAYWNLKQSKK